MSAKDRTPRTLVRKLLDAHLVGGTGEELELSVDQILIEDVTGTMCAMQFEALGVDRSAVPLAVMYVDHNVLQLDTRDMEAHRYLREFSARYGLRTPPGNGISHYVHLERFSRPGALLLGADSHTTAAGGVGSLAIGAGGLEVAVAMAGHPFVTAAPEIVGVRLDGALSDWVEAKDVILELLRRFGVRGGVGTIFEFFGDGVATLSATERATICNMVVETGATTGVFPSDGRVREWLEAQGRGGDWVELGPDAGAEYDRVEAIDLAALEPLIALPSSPGNVVPVREVAGTRTAQVCVGSSVNSSYEELAVVAAVLRGRTLPADVQLTVTPGSRQILDTIRAAASTVTSSLRARGCSSPSAARASASARRRRRGCLGAHVQPQLPGAERDAGRRRLPLLACDGRGHRATRGDHRPADARDAARARARDRRPRPRRRADRPAAARRRGARARGHAGGEHRLAAAGTARAETIEGRVAVVVGDDISTGDMAPDGAIGMSLWSDAAACAEWMFSRQDPEFPARGALGRWADRRRAQLRSGLVARGGRDRAADRHPSRRGQELPRIHRRNLICQGILPLTFANEADQDGVAVGDTWRIEGAREAVETGAEAVTAFAGDRPSTSA